MIVFGSIADARLYEEETRMIEQHRRRRQKYISTMIWTKVSTRDENGAYLLVLLSCFFTYITFRFVFDICCYLPILVISSQRIRKSDLNPSRPELVDLTHDTATETRNATMAENKREMSAAASASASIETCDNNKGNARISHPTSRTKQSDNNSIRCICTTTDNDDATSESTNGRDTAASRSSCNGNCCVECDDVADSNDGEGDNHDDKNNSTMFSMCSICLEDFEDGDIVCQSPNCRHIFHEDCMSEWLLRHDDCPCCRSPYLSSTPPPPPTLPTSDTGHTPIAAVTDNYHEQIPPLQSDTPAERPNRNAGNGRIHGYGNFLSASTARPSSSPSPPSSSSNTSPRVIVTYVRPVSASWGVLPPTDVPQHGDEGGHRIVSQHVILDQDQQHDHRRRQQQEQEQLYDAEGQDEQPLPPPFGVVVGGGRYVGTDMFVMEDLPPWLVMAGTVW